MIDLDRAKVHLRVDFDTEDDLIAAYLAAAVGLVEKRTGRLLAQRALVQRLDVFPGFGDSAGAGGGAGNYAAWASMGRRRNGQAILLNHDPVVSVEGIDYLDGDGGTITLTGVGGGYRTVAGEPFLLLPAVGVAWPYSLGGGGAVQVRYTAGYAADAVPGELDAAVLLMVGHLYANREAVAVGIRADAELPMGVDALCEPFRRIGIG